MKRNKKLMAAVLTVVLALSSVTVFAQGTVAQAQQGSETILEDNRTLTEKGNANLVDNVSDSEDLQFITVTSKEGDTFYFIIDKAAESDNVYFLNKVDDSDLAALTEDGEITKAGTTVTEPEPEKPETSPEPESEKGTETKEVEPQTFVRLNNEIVAIPVKPSIRKQLNINKEQGGRDGQKSPEHKPPEL
ncbi:MAG: DUF4366 domain-containing protein [Clostridia bacterium]|nr:DUF4366 domain-containing protein [Clostridia bacterium]